MRKVLQRRIKNKSLPLFGSLRGGGVLGKDHSLEGIMKAIEYDPDILELDTRLSSDKIIYCFHGSIPLGVILAKCLFILFKFRTIKRFLPHVHSLGEILKKVPSNVDVFLDIKSSHIQSQYILDIIHDSGYSGQVWIGSNLKNLNKLRSGLGEDFIYYLNYYLPINFANIIKKAEGKVDVIELPETLASSRNLSLIKNSGIVPQVSSFKDGDEKKAALAFKYGNICLDLRDIRFKKKVNSKNIHETV